MNTLVSLRPYLLEGTDRGGWKTIKTITSHTGLGQWYAELEAQERRDPVGYVATPAQVPSPYSYGPSVMVYTYHGLPVIMRETSHKRYEIVAVPRDETIYKTDQEASDAFIARRKG